jgi:hypothetical protein
MESASSLKVGWQGYAEYLVDAGRSRIEARLGDVDVIEGTLCACLSVLPLALPLFDLEPLHGSAVLAPEGAVVLLGPSGAGKSSLVTALANRGLPFLADDACAIDSSHALWPAPPLIGLRDAGVAPVVGRYNDKSIVTPAVNAGDAVPVAAAVALRPNPAAPLSISALAGVRSVTTLLSAARAPATLKQRRRKLQLDVVTGLTNRAVVAEMSYAPGRHSVDHTADALLSWIRDRALWAPAKPAPAPR